MEVPLSQSPKKPGARDISDLKARLGLKKGGPAAKPRPASGSVPPPLGAAPAPAPVPPPGAAPAAPDPRQD
ncbi:MAG: hypothetical protein D6689_21285, partial [Deltaproteobacteria bacterium]